MTDVSGQADHPEPDYLDQAARTLHKALTYWEQQAIRRPDDMRAEILDACLRIAEGFAKLAAVQRGVPPCCHHARPGPDAGETS